MGVQLSEKSGLKGGKLIYIFLYFYIYILYFSACMD